MCCTIKFVTLTLVLQYIYAYLRMCVQPRYSEGTFKVQIKVNVGQDHFPEFAGYAFQCETNLRLQ